MESKGNSKEEVEEYSFIKANEIAAHEEDEDSALIKRKIACHALYPILVESHLNCLKICLGNEDIDSVAVDIKLNSSVANQPDLDQFMEAFYMTLNKLKQAIEEPQKESMEFIKNMHSQLEELMENPSSATLSQSNGNVT